MLKKFIFYAIIAAPLLCLAILTWYISFQTNLLQTTYIDSLRNIYFDCIHFVDDAYVYKAKPGVCPFSNLEYSIQLTHDQEGFRNPNTLSKRDIVFLGDSHTHGWGVNDDQTFTHLTQSLTGLKTINLAIASYATQTELEALKAYTNGEKVIVMQYCENDEAENQSSIDLDSASFHATKTKWWKEYINKYFDSKKLGLSVPLGYFSRHLLARDFLSKSEVKSAIYKRDINKEAHNFATILARYPDLLYGKKLILFESNSGGMNSPQFKSAFEAAVKEKYPQLDLVVLDSSSFLDSSDYYFLDDHLNPQGHEKIARVLKPLL